MKLDRHSSAVARACPPVLTALGLLVVSCWPLLGCSLDQRGLDVRDLTVDGGGGAGAAGGSGGVLALGGAGGGNGSGGRGGSPIERDAAVDHQSEPVPSQATRGAACAEGAQCQSGHCVDGLCCESACDETCSACSASRTGGEDGSCLPVVAGSDPDDECEAEPGNSCGRTGACGGGRACALAPAASACGAPSCAGHTLTPASLCDGSGACKPGSAAACAAGLRCETATACRSRCDSSSHCTAGNFCDLGTGQCMPGKALGAACDPAVEAGQCASGHCVDGVCCDSSCGSLCSACSQAKTGLASGRCAPVKAGSDPDSECRRDAPSSCGQDGACNGAGACRAYPDGTVCGTTCCDRGPGRGSRPCAYACRSGRCDTANPSPGAETCGNFSCCCPTGGANGEAACVSSLLGCPAGCQ